MTTPPKRPKPNPLPEQDGKGSGSALAGLGMQFGAAIVLCVLVGNWIDGRYATGPWGVLVGALTGFAAGFYSIFRAAKADEARHQAEEDADKRGK
jgi:ATP synthase protein I